MNSEFVLLGIAILLLTVSWIVSRWNFGYPFSARIDFFRFSLEWKFTRFMDAVAWRITCLMPKWLVSLAVIRAIAHGTTGKYGSTDASDVRAMTVVKRWEGSNE